MVPPIVGGTLRGQNSHYSKLNKINNLNRSNLGSVPRFRAVCLAQALNMYVIVTKATFVTLRVMAFKKREVGYEKNIFPPLDDGFGHVTMGWMR